ncbi:MAG: hypothetical protein KAS57_02820 [Gammaproteobacteria bacterium]|nr:hypothetical protein [Gammaproteobacteria bacterium]
MKSLIIMLVVFVLATWGYILVTDTRVLIEEITVEAGQPYVVDGYGDLRRYNRTSLACKYFNGRKVFQTVYWYSQNNYGGRDSCPFIKKVEIF